MANSLFNNRSWSECTPHSCMHWLQRLLQHSWTFILCICTPPCLLLLATRVNLGRKLKLPPSLKTIHLLAVLLASGYAIVMILWQIRTPACSSLWIDRQVTGMSQKESGARGPPLDPPVSARLQRAANHMRSYFSTYTVSEDRWSAAAVILSRWLELPRARRLLG